MLVIEGLLLFDTSGEITTDGDEALVVFVSEIRIVSIRKGGVRDELVGVDSADLGEQLEVEVFIKIITNE